MELFPTWRVWRLVHGHMSLEMYELLVRVLRVKHPARGVSYLSNVWTWIVISFLSDFPTSLGSLYFAYAALTMSLSLPTFNSINFVSPALISFVTLRYATRVLNAINTQRTGGSYDLFALLPAGEFTNVCNILRAHRHPLQGVAVGIIPAVLLCLLLWGMTAGYPLSFGSSLEGFNNVAYFALPVMLRGIASFVDYVQAFSAATLIALLASRRQQRSEAQITLIGGFLALQVGLYVIVGGFSAQLANLLVFSVSNFTRATFMIMSYSSLLLLQSLILIAMREVVNGVLWNWVRLQFEDDDSS
ncbi:MAG: hypothetical protein U0694_14220 [Anaerolineae bacterium]